MKELINTEQKTNVSAQLYEVLREIILSKKYKENDKFLSIRQISIKFSVNPNTVLKVIKILEENGYLYNIKGKGCFIKKGYKLDINDRMIPILNTFRFGQNSKNKEINFSNGAPPKEYFPISSYQNIMKEIFATKNEVINLMGYQNIQGLETLRETLSNYVKRYGIYTTKENIMICSGTQAILQLICLSFGIMPKKNVLLSDPTYQNAVHVLKNYCDINTIKLEYDGWDMKELEEVLKRKKIHFIYMMSNFQNPTGINWSIYKKRKLLELAKKYDFYIIEDACFSDFFYNKNEYQRSLKAMDKNDVVFYLKTFSKIVMPSLALAMLIPPKDFVESFSLNKYFIDTTTSGINQKFLELFIKKGYLDSHLSNIREIFKEKMEYMINELSKISHLKILHRPRGGFFIWVELADYIDSEKFYYKCRLKGVSILPGFIFYSSNKKTSFNIRLSVVSVSFKEMKEGLSIIQDILNNCEGVPEI